MVAVRVKGVIKHKAEAKDQVADTKDKAEAKDQVDVSEFIGVNNGLGSITGPVQLPDFRPVVELFQH